MKKYIAALLLVVISATSFAQNTSKRAKHKPKKHVEKVVINSKDKKTIVEVKDNKIYVDGELVSTIKNGKTEDHKIVINHAGTPAHNKQGGWHETHKKEVAEEATEPTPPQPAGDMADTQPMHEAMLGVYSNKMSPVTGAYVSGVVPGSPAENAGLRMRDVITEVNNVAINTSHELVTTIKMYKPGDKVTISYLRDGNEEKTEVTLEDREEFEAQVPFNGQSGDNNRNNSNDDQRQYFGFRDDNGNDGNFYWRNDDDNNQTRNSEGPGGWQHMFFPQRKHEPVQIGIDAIDGRHPRGVYLENVKPGSPAEQAGLQKGDIITRVNGKRVKSADLMRFLMTLRETGNVIWIDYRHNGQRMQTEIHVAQDQGEQNQRRNHHFSEDRDDTQW